MSSYKKIYCPCDDCQYSYSKNGQEMNTCNICEYKYLKDSWENNIDKVVEQLEGEIELVVKDYPLQGRYIKKSRAIEIVKGGAE